MAEHTEGSFSYSILDNKDNIWLVKGDSPLSITHFPKLKLYVYASTDEILYKALVDFPETFKAIRNGEYEDIKINEGEIIKIRPNGIIERNTFEYTYYYGRGWWEYDSYLSLSSRTAKKGYTRDDYIDDLKSVAIHMGYTSDDVDTLLYSGFDLDEIEDFMYCGGEI